MIPWIQVYSNMPQHPKTTKLADELGLTSAALNPNTMAAGMLVSLWSWAIQNAHNGDLSGCSDRAIADACQWKRRPDKLVSALMAAGYMDEDRKLHDWDDYTSMYQDLQSGTREKHRERQRRYRERKKRDVTVTSRDDDCDAVPNLTKPNLTIPDHVGIERNVSPLSLPSCGGGGGCAQARAKESEDVEEYLQSRDLDPGVFFGASEELLQSVRALTEALYARFSGRKPTDADVGRVFQAACSRSFDGARWRVQMAKDRKDLLMYAFEAASSAGKGGDWKYIGGVLDRLAQREILTLADAEEYDSARENER